MVNRKIESHFAPVLLNHVIFSKSSGFLSGKTERVEMVLENVVIEISKHRDVGTVYLTNYRYNI